MSGINKKPPSSIYKKVKGLVSRVVESGKEAVQNNARLLMKAINSKSTNNSGGESVLKQFIREFMKVFFGLELENGPSDESKRAVQSGPSQETDTTKGTKVLLRPRVYKAEMRQRPAQPMRVGSMPEQPNNQGGSGASALPVAPPPPPVPPAQREPMSEQQTSGAPPLELKYVEIEHDASCPITLDELPTETSLVLDPDKHEMESKAYVEEKGTHMLVKSFMSGDYGLRRCPLTRENIGPGSWITLRQLNERYANKDQNAQKKQGESSVSQQQPPPQTPPPVPALQNQSGVESSSFVGQSGPTVPPQTSPPIPAFLDQRDRSVPLLADQSRGPIPAPPNQSGVESSSFVGQSGPSLGPVMPETSSEPQTTIPAFLNQRDRSVPLLADQSRGPVSAPPNQSGVESSSFVGQSGPSLGPVMPETSSSPPPIPANDVSSAQRSGPVPAPQNQSGGDTGNNLPPLLADQSKLESTS